MRTAFIQRLIEVARENPRLFLAVGELGYSVIEPFAEEFPDRFLNAGVAEQNMTGLAAGLASEGYHVFTYSIGNFPTLRCLEQIRNDVCYHNLPVTVVAVGAGMAYGNQGYSHHCVQDLACLRGMPNMTVLSPADPHETRACMDWLSKNPGPSYLRLGKAGEAEVHDGEVSFERPVIVADRQATVAIVGTGAVTAEANRAGDILADRGTPCDVLSCVRIAPVGKEYFEFFDRYKTVFAVEEHVEPGGLGEMLRANLSRHIGVLCRSIPDRLASTVGTQQTLRQLAGLDAKSLAEWVGSTLARSEC